MTIVADKLGREYAIPDGVDPAVYPGFEAGLGNSAIVAIGGEPMPRPGNAGQLLAEAGAAEAPPPAMQELAYVNPSVTPSSKTMGIPSWGSFNVDPEEYVPALKWPQSVKTYTRMRSDPQITSCLRGLTVPIRRFHWYVDPSGARPEVVNTVAQELGLPVKGRKRPLGYYRNRFWFDSHIREAFLSLIYGHMFFERVGDIRAGRGGNLIWRLEKFTPIMPETINEIKVARDGSLEWIKQMGEFTLPNVTPPEISANSILSYVHDKEGGNWFGRSLIREAYQPWMLKDRLLRVDAARHERNGMGVPIVELPERATESQRREGQALANQYRAGQASGGAVPFGMKLRLIGVEGTTSDVLGSIRYHDEAVSKLMLQMFNSLGAGSTYGSKSLGDTFVQFFAQAQDVVADWFAWTFNYGQIADQTYWNWGPDEQPPAVAWERRESPELSANELGQLVAQGALVVDDPFEDYLRDRYHLPERDPGTARKVPGSVPATMPPSTGEPNTNVTPEGDAKRQDSTQQASLF